MSVSQGATATSRRVHVDPPAVRFDESGRYRIGETRVLLDLLVLRYDAGATPEDVVRSCPSLSLPEVHAAIAYYLRHRGEVLEYLRTMDVEAEELRLKLEREGINDPGLGRRLKDRLAAQNVSQRDGG